MNGYVYVLKSLKFDRYYIGSSENPDNRLNNYHNLGKVIATKYGVPWIIVFAQKYLSIKIARQIEYKLKSFKSRKIIEEIIKDGFCKIKCG